MGAIDPLDLKGVECFFGDAMAGPPTRIVAAHPPIENAATLTKTVGDSG